MTSSLGVCIKSVNCKAAYVSNIGFLPFQSECLWDVTFLLFCLQLVGLGDKRGLLSDILLADHMLLMSRGF